MYNVVNAIVVWEVLENHDLQQVHAAASLVFSDPSWHAAYNPHLHT